MVIVIDCFKLQVSTWLVNLSYNCNCDWLIELLANNLPSELEENDSIFQTNHNRGNFIFMIKSHYVSWLFFENPATNAAGEISFSPAWKLESWLR